MEKKIKKFFIIILSALLVMSLFSGCRYDIPEGYQKKPHSKQDAQNYINEYLGADITLLENFEDIIDEYGRKIRRWSAEYQSIPFFVVTRQEMIFDTTGEFTKNCYHLATDYNLCAVQKIFDPIVYNYVLLEDLEQFRRYRDTVFFQVVVPNRESFDSVFIQAKTCNKEINTAFPAISLKFLFYTVDSDNKKTSIGFFNSEDYFTSAVDFDKDYEKVLAFFNDYFSEK